MMAAGEVPCALLRRWFLIPSLFRTLRCEQNPAKVVAQAVALVLLGIRLSGVTLAPWFVWLELAVFFTAGFSVALAASLCLVMLLLDRKSDGIEHAPLMGDGPDLSVHEAAPASMCFDEGALAIGIGLIAVVIVFFAAYFPLLGITRLVARIGYHGIIKA